MRHDNTPIDVTKISAQKLAKIKVVLTDLDDTLTTFGQLSSIAYAALERLYMAGLITVIVTGRPAGWCDLIARMWPVDGVIGENGAFWFSYDRKNRYMKREYWGSIEDRNASKVKLAELSKKIINAVPGCMISSDQNYRESDLAIDFCEDLSGLKMEEIQRIVRIFQAEGANAQISSIHVNGWFGSYNKLSMTKKYLSDNHSLDINADYKAIAFVGDSPNDAPMFEYFPCSVGVSNVMKMAGQVKVLPKYITSKSGGAGFVEFADLVLNTLY